MTDWNNIAEKGNAWELIYACFVAVENAPLDYCDYFEDEDGNEYEGISYNTIDNLRTLINDYAQEELELDHLVRLSQAIGVFVRECQSENFTFPFTYKAYLDNKDIIGTIEGFGLDVEQFWYAILFIFWLTQIRCVNVIVPKGSTGEQMQNLSDYLQRVDSFTIKVEGKKKLTINDSMTISGIREFLDTKFKENEKEGFNNGYSYRLAAKGEELISSSVQMWFSTERYLKLFENLELPTIRATDSKVKYTDDWGEKEPTRGGNKTVSYNKMLLISRIMYFTRMTRNENFLSSDESLKGIVKQYKNLKINAYRPECLF